ncbi:hypothetical protein LARI1_G004980 [Lachnellula arida]|uniref:Extracellular membrane protein CFEM domain-containing protein n=1 Tax=Lachnellula arida TaxID=1316785 RepID=A0A8T9BBF7_9HELO|nr:hypothetical protein LARI1_G004980 [Lachnellula arida]
MVSSNMLLALPIVVLQILGVDATFEHVVFPRDNAPEAFQDHLLDGPGVILRAVPAACGYALDALDYCSSISPGFLSMAPSRQAPCLCYSSTAWIPSAFDGAVSTCADYAMTADPQDYSAIAPLKGFCSNVGNVRPASTPATATATRASSASGASGAPATTAISSAFAAQPSVSPSYCSSVSPGFLIMPSSDQRHCLCYSASSFNPSFFDNAVQTYADYAQTADPADYSDIAALEGFCSSVGDVLQNANIAAPTTRNSGSTTALAGGPQTGNTAPGSKTAASSSSAASTPSVTGGNGVGGGGAVTVTATSPAPAPATTSKTSSASGMTLNWALGMSSVIVSIFFFLR